MATPLPQNRAAFSVTELLAATGGALAARGSAQRATHVSTNTRAIQPGAVFVALRGKVHDGHAYVGAAAAAGAPVAIVDRAIDAPPAMTIVRVDSTLRALGDLARAHVQRWQALGDRTLVGITGSAGKTTTRVATTALVEHLFPGELVATRGNLNNRIGVPMMLFSLDATRRIAVLELGTSEPGEIAELCRIAQPDVGILTLVAAAHVEGLGSIEGVALEKGALFRALPPQGIAIGNLDDARVRQALDAAPCARRAGYGRHAQAVAKLIGRTPVGMTRSNVVLAHAGERISTFETPLVGEAGALACAAAVAAVEAAFGVSLDGDALTWAFREVRLGHSTQRLVPHQLASGLAVIDDSYNANPASMAASIQAAAEMATIMQRRLVLVLGEMRELGSEAARGHQQVGRVAAASGAALIIAIGAGETPRMATTARQAGAQARHHPSVADAAAAVCAAVRPNDLVLVKASRSVGADRIVAALARQHSDAHQAPSPDAGSADPR